MQGQVLPLAACRALGTESGTGDWRPSGYTAVMTRPEASADIPFQLHSPYRPAGDQPQAIRQLVEGFEANLSDSPVHDCEELLRKFLGSHGSDFNTEFLSEGSFCLGRMCAYYFYAQMSEMGQLDALNLDMVKTGSYILM